MGREKYTSIYTLDASVYLSLSLLFLCLCLWGQSEFGVYAANIELKSWDFSIFPSHIVLTFIRVRPAQNKLVTSSDFYSIALSALALGQHDASRRASSTI